MAGFNFLPRQDAYGAVESYQFYVTPDGKEWGEPVAVGSFEFTTTSVPHNIKARNTKRGRYVKFVATRGVDNTPVADAAEIGVFVANP